jgi:hypothetical protein
LCRDRAASAQELQKTVSRLQEQLMKVILCSASKNGIHDQQIYAFFDPLLLQADDRSVKESIASARIDAAVVPLKDKCAKLEMELQV